MALPKQVEAALAAADATLAAANGQQTQEPSEVATLAQDEPTEPPFTQADPQPQAAPEVPPPQVEDPAWEKRYRVLQGKYDAEVPRLHHQVRDLETNLRAAIDRMDAASRAKESAPEQRAVTDPRDVENFGQDLVEMVSRVSGASVAKLTQMLDGKLSQFEGQLNHLYTTMQGTTQQVAVTAEQSFFDRVSKLVPEWEQVNTDPAFLAWLAETDPVYGVNRQAALQKAQNSLNADHAAAVFQAFLGPKKAQPKAPDPLDKQVSPRSAATVTPVQAQAQTIRQADITKFYDDVRRGMYRGNEAEATRIEQVINAALSEGRVR